MKKSALLNCSESDTFLMNYTIKPVNNSTATLEYIKKSPNSFLPGLSHSIINQFRFHNFLCLSLASVHLPHPFHLVFGFQLLGHAVLLCQRPHDQLHAVLCRFVNLIAILSYVHPAMAVRRFSLFIFPKSASVRSGQPASRPSGRTPGSRSSGCRPCGRCAACRAAS